VEIDIKPDHDKAKARASARQKEDRIAVFSDISGQHNHLGAAVVALDQNQNITQYWKVCISSMEYWSVYAAKLMAIYYAISLVYQIVMKNQGPQGTGHQPAIILSKSMSALQAIANRGNKSGQKIIQAIT
jgi:hypothetical protein